MNLIHKAIENALMFDGDEICTNATLHYQECAAADADRIDNTHISICRIRLHEKNIGIYKVFTDEPIFINSIQLLIDLNEIVDAAYVGGLDAIFSSTLTANFDKGLLTLCLPYDVFARICSKYDIVDGMARKNAVEI